MKKINKINLKIIIILVAKIIEEEGKNMETLLKRRKKII
jgi:hypothetical protein